ncbi:hypothetical protein TH19_00580 [Thalassospira profundimaris]|uniref:Uncharacterized protein n=1 Tax=Thalassospira profundimaris TaxID=502049 RepID=A0A367WDT8_9PROT|nr:hypothetical protein TH19_00580 [Thalassospira profundimaris]
MLFSIVSIGGVSIQKHEKPCLSCNYKVWTVRTPQHRLRALPDGQPHFLSYPKKIFAYLATTDH